MSTKEIIDNLLELLDASCFYVMPDDWIEAVSLAVGIIKETGGYDE